MTSSLYFLPPTSSPPWLLISSKISSVAPLWGMPQGAAGPERGVSTPNLLPPAAPPFPGATPTSSAATKSVTHVRGNQCLIAIPSLSGRDYTIGFPLRAPRPRPLPRRPRRRAGLTRCAPVLRQKRVTSDSHGDSACSCDRHQARRVVGGCPRQAVASLRPSVPPSSERLAAWDERQFEGRSGGGGARERRPPPRPAVRLYGPTGDSSRRPREAASSRP